jgi:hypothetical protein
MTLFWIVDIHTDVASWESEEIGNIDEHFTIELLDDSWVHEQQERLCFGLLWSLFRAPILCPLVYIALYIHVHTQDRLHD